VTPELDCGDNGCYFAVNKGGMRTNGGCRCFSNAGFSKGSCKAEVRRIAAATRFAEFDYVTKNRPMDSCYWDMHRRNELKAALK
jgi:hypothetical protein